MKTPVSPETTKAPVSSITFAHHDGRPPKIFGWRLRAVRPGEADLP